MTVKVIIEKIDERRFRASIEQPFSIESEGATEDEALSRLRELAVARLNSRKVVDLDLDMPEDNPWLKLAGMWKDNPDLDEYRRNIEEHRKEMDALELP